jgi:hypothetical protein
MMERFPFSYRAGLLAVLMGIGAVLDLWRHGRAATRYKEYAFIWLTGFLGCLAGGITDLLTSSISPYYFMLGKGLLGGEGFNLRVAMFGVREGMSAGVIAGAICVYVSRRKSKYPPLGFGKLLGLLWIPIVWAVAGSLLLPLLFGRSDPAGLASKFYDGGLALQLDRFLVIGQTDAFLHVWWIHTGLYAGLLAGLLWLVALVFKLRRTAPAAAAAA